MNLKVIYHIIIQIFMLIEKFIHRYVLIISEAPLLNGIPAEI